MAAAQELSFRYRCDERDMFRSFMTSEAHRLAYLTFRMPATYAVNSRVLGELKIRMPSFSPDSIGDFGAGPGTATWAAADIYPEITKATLVEKDENWLEIGARMMKNSGQGMLQKACWERGDVMSMGNLNPYDLLLMSYMIGELPFESIDNLMTLAWNVVGQVLVIIEPGTPHGFERIKKARSWLIEHGAFLVAPCPHQEQCPMSQGDWCHFAERLERSALHRIVKEGTMAYEDEKFSYIIAAKTSILLPEGRILRHPQHHSGHIEFILCGQNGLEKKVISRRHGDLYKLARKLDWGDSWPQPH